MHASRWILLLLSPMALLVFSEIAAHENSARAVGSDAVDSCSKDDLLRPTRKPSRLVGEEDPALDRFCQSPDALPTRVDCAPTLTDTVAVRNFLPPPVIVANLPHLRLDIVLTRMENQAVSGGGISVDPEDYYDSPWATWYIESSVSTSSIPAVGDDPFGLPVPPNPGEVWDNLDHANALYQGIIENGCSASTVFDVSLDSAVIRYDGATLGDVLLFDEVVGTGFFVFAYTIRATDEDGAVSDFLFSGDARAYCTGQASF